MKVRMLKTMAGPAGCHREGEIADLPKAVAYDLCEAGAAAQLETATTGPGETAALRGAGPKRRRRKKAASETVEVTAAGAGGGNTAGGDAPGEEG